MTLPIITMELQPLLTGSLLIVTAFIFLTLVFLFFYQKKYYLRLHEKEKLKASFREELLLVRLEIMEQTLRNISYKFHDIIGQEMSLIKLNLSTMDSTDPADIESKMFFSKDLLGKAIRELRDLSKSLTADSIIGMGLYKAIEYELEKIQRSGSIRTRLLSKGELPEPDARRSLVLFRIIQELLQNRTRHASANNIYVTALVHNSKLMLALSDDGKELGPGMMVESNEPGIDFRTIKKRISLIDADLKIENIKDKGNIVSIFLPLENQKLV